MDIEEIKKLWKPEEQDAQASLDWWNSKAEHFRLKELPTAENSLAMEIIEREGLIKKGDRVLDVGCGGGRLSFAVEMLGAEVVGADFSPEMIKRARAAAQERASSADFVQADWHTADIKELGWEKSFDFVLANMTPAVVSADTFLKLIEASRSRVLMIKPVKRINPLYDELLALTSAGDAKKPLKDSVEYSVEILLSMGLSPRLQYHRGVSESARPIEAVREDYTKRIATRHALSEDDLKKIDARLESAAEDGIIKERGEWTVAAIYFTLKD